MKNFLSIILIFSISLISYAGDTIQGGISQKANTNRIIDKQTGKGISGAKITIPKRHYQTKTDKYGYFELDTSINGNTIMSVKKENYKPFSMTINSLNAPLIVGIEKSDNHDIIIDSNMYHLGDNSYSKRSANAGDFKTTALGPFYSKKVSLRGVDLSKPVYIVIGSIIGIDTILARSIGQNHYPDSYASPPEIFFNGNKIAEIQINGDGQRIKIPQPLIRKNKSNEITIKTGRNLMQTSYVDYDDIEFMNLSIEN